MKPPPDRCWRVLYVEDDRVAILLFEEALRGHADFEVRVAESAAEALQQVTGWVPDILVVDAHLPDGHANAVLPLLRAHPQVAASTPAVVLSADIQDVARDPRAQYAAWWIKPVQPDALAPALRRLLSGVHA